MRYDMLFRLILALLFVFVVVMRRYFERKAANIAKDGLKQDQDPRALIAFQSLLLTLGNLAVIAYLINPSWMAWSSLTMSEWVRWIGAPFRVVGAGLLTWTHRVLGKNFFGGIKIREGHQFITHGPYRWIRHPIYTAFLLLGLAWFLLSGNWMIGGSWLAATLLVLATRLDEEERMMLREFGDAYRIYEQQTGRLLPRLRSTITSSDSRT